jgi:hypothetical protein
MLADRSTGLYLVSLPSQPFKQWGQSQPSAIDQLLGLSGPYHGHATGTFNTCSRGPTHRSLNDTGGGYSLEGTSFPHATPWPFQPMVFTFHLRAPPGLQFNYNLPKVRKFEFKKPMAATWSFDHSAIYRNLYLCLAISNGMSLAIGSTRIDQKVNLMQLGYQFNSYNLIHIQES